LGKNIPVSEAYPHWVLVIIPPFLRAKVRTVRVLQADQPVPMEHCYADHFWIRITSREPDLYCEIELQPSAVSAAAPTPALEGVTA
jgi:hypothetical protein